VEIAPEPTPASLAGRRDPLPSRAESMTREIAAVAGCIRLPTLATTTVHAYDMRFAARMAVSQRCALRC
jgi:hypothetical protein